MQANDSALREGDSVMYNGRVYRFKRLIRGYRQEMAEIQEIEGCRYYWLPDECYWNLSERTLRVSAGYIKKVKGGEE